MAVMVAVFWIAPLLEADWPMPGHDVQRTSWAATDSVTPMPTVLKWSKAFDPWLPASAQIITSATENKIYVTAADGIYALDPLTGNTLWKYALTLPPGQSPTYASGTLYLAGTDKTVHAINAATGVRRWQTLEAGRAFYASPIVVNDRVYVGSLDGRFYSFNATTGAYVWSYNVGAPIQYGAAYQTYGDYPNGVLFFAAQDLRAYALRADTGALVWQSSVLPGAERFQMYWPVIFDDLVVFVAGTIFPSQDNFSITNLQRAGMAQQYTSIPVSNGWYNLTQHQTFQANYPYLRTTYVLDRSTGAHSQYSPFMHAGSQQAYRYPPVVGPNPAGGSPTRLLWARSPWHGGPDDFFGFGRFIGWQVGTALARLVPGLQQDIESADEGDVFTIIGNAYIVGAKGAYGEGGWSAGFFPLAGGPVINVDGGNPNSRMGERKYNYGMNDGNPPVPLNGRIYLHEAATVLCFGPQ